MKKPIIFVMLFLLFSVSGYAQGKQPKFVKIETQALISVIEYLAALRTIGICPSEKINVILTALQRAKPIEEVKNEKAEKSVTDRSADTVDSGK